MPVLTSNFSPTFLFKNGHFNTIYRNVFTKITHQYQRKRITTWDQDFIDLDFSVVGSKTLVVLIHGLEGSSESSYMIAAVKELNAAKIDCVSFNLRGCSGEDNLLLTTYHSGKTEDVDFVVTYLTTKYAYDHIAIVGYSLGGNLTLKYMGEYADQLSPIIKVAVAISVPIDLASSDKQLSRFQNTIYMRRFLRSLRKKIRQKAAHFPHYIIDDTTLATAKNFQDFDALYTAPVFGFKNSADYWQQASSNQFLSKIKTPTLLINALDDPFLGNECYPHEIAQHSNSFYLETPTYGGHCGFNSTLNGKPEKWLEHRIIKFITKNIESCKKQHNISS